MVKKTVYDEEGNASIKNRMRVDFRKVNQVSKGDAYPVPNLELMLNRLQEAKFLSTVDLSMAYHQIPVTAQSRHLTAFVFPGKGIFECVAMPFGLKGATETFQRAISQIITPEMSPFAMAYLDDIIIATSTWED